MEAYDLEIGPIQRTFENLFKRIGEYFNSTPVEPEGKIVETDLSLYSQESLSKILNELFKFYGFGDLPVSYRIVVEEGSLISGIHRSDNITTYEEKMQNGSRRTFNFYNKYGPGNMKVSFYWLDTQKDGEEIQGILTFDDRWYLRIITTAGNMYYLRMEKEKDIF